MYQTGGSSFAPSVQDRHVSLEAPAVLPFVTKPDTPEPARMEPTPPALTAPNFGTISNSGSLRKRAILVGVGLLLVTLTLAAVGRLDHAPSSPSPAAMGGEGWVVHVSPPAAAMETGGAGWVSEWVSDPRGSALGRQISLYRPSMGMSDYRLEFTGRIERKSLGWVFRAADTKNYYVGKVQVSEPTGRLAVTRFAVVRGVEGPRTRITLPLIPGSETLRVRLDAKQSQFTIYVQNEVVDDWQDDQVASGGVGFLSERDERGQVESVQISFPKNGVVQ
jgi:hypothetical protein